MLFLLLEFGLLVMPYASQVCLCGLASLEACFTEDMLHWELLLRSWGRVVAARPEQWFCHVPLSSVFAISLVTRARPPLAFCPGIRSARCDAIHLLAY
jgi:hypothetical protein